MKFDLSEIKSLLARTQEIIDKVDNPDVEFIQPTRAFHAISFLVDDSYCSNLEDLLHDYPDKPNLEIEMNGDLDRVVRHGHNAGQMCAAPHFCHIATFRPEFAHPPSFKKAFNRKWGYK